MNAGKPIRLSEKLNEELDVIRQEHVVSTASQLQSFRTDLKAIASAAQRTIESDMQQFLNENRSLFETRNKQIRRWLTISPYVISGLIVTGIASMMVASYFWALQMKRSELADLGLTRIERRGQIWLTLDPARAELRTCTVDGHSVYCIEILEE